MIIVLFDPAYVSKSPLSRMLKEIEDHLGIRAIGLEVFNLPDRVVIYDLSSIPEVHAEKVKEMLKGLVLV